MPLDAGIRCNRFCKCGGRCTINDMDDIVPLRVEQSKKSLKPGHREVCLCCHGKQDLNFIGICVCVICLMH